MGKTVVEEKIFDQIFKDLDLKAVVDTAIFKALTKEAKDTLVSSVLEHLVSPSNPRGYSDYDKKTHLQLAFESSIRDVVNVRMAEVIRQDTAVQEEVERFTKAAAQKFIDMDKTDFIEKLSDDMRKLYWKLPAEITKEED